MRVLYIITRAETGGAQTHVLDLLVGLKNNCDCFLAIGEEGFLTKEARALGVPVHFVPGLIRGISPGNDLCAFFRIVRLIRLAKPDLVHLHSTKAGFLGRLASRFSFVPSVFTAHGWAFEDAVPRLQKIVALPVEWIAARCCDAIIAVSQSGYALSRRYRVASALKLRVIYYGISDTPCRANPDTGRPINIVMVARFAPQKDHLLMLNAFSRLSSNCRLIFVGDGPARARVQSEADSLFLTDRVEFLGNRSDVAEILAGAHVFALATNWEGLPISILEAMRASLPIVATDAGGVAEEVVDGETGFLVPRGDVAAVRDRLSKLLADPQLRSRMGAAGRRRFEQLFSLDRMLEKTVKVYREVVGARKVG